MSYVLSVRTPDLELAHVLYAHASRFVSQLIAGKTPASASLLRAPDRDDGSLSESEIIVTFDEATDGLRSFVGDLVRAPAEQQISWWIVQNVRGRPPVFLSEHFAPIDRFEIPTEATPRRVLSQEETAHEVLLKFQRAAIDVVRNATPERNGARISFKHPVTGEPLVFDVRWGTAPTPLPRPKTGLGFLGARLKGQG